MITRLCRGLFAAEYALIVHLETRPDSPGEPGMQPRLVRSGPSLEESVSRPQGYLDRFFHFMNTLLRQTPSQVRLPFIPSLGSLLVCPFS